MDKNHFGEYMHQLRKSKKITQLEMAEELGVSAAYVSRIERGVKTPSYFLYEAIMLTLGEYSGDYVTVFMPKDKIMQYKSLSMLRCAIRDGRTNEAKKHLHSLEDTEIKISDELLQFIMYAKVVLADDISPENAIKQLMAALEVGKKRFSLPHVGESMLRYNDIIILDELANRRAQNGDVDFAVDLLTAVKNSMDKFYIDEREKSVTYPILLFNLSRLLGMRGQHDDVLRLCGAAIKMSLQYNNMKIIPSLIYNIASAKYSKGDKSGCKKAVIETYYAAVIFEDYALAEIAKKDAKETFGIEYEQLSFL